MGAELPQFPDGSLSLNSPCYIKRCSIEDQVFTELKQPGSESLFASDRHLDALIAAIDAKHQLQSFGNSNLATSSQVDRALQQAVLGADESNRLVGHQGAVKGVAFSHDGRAIATASGDKTVKVWNRNGKLLQTLIGHKSLVWDVSFSPFPLLYWTCCVAFLPYHSRDR